MGAEYLGVTLPGDVKEQLTAMTVDQMVDAINQTEVTKDTVDTAWGMDLNDPEQALKVLEILRDSVADLSHWGTQSIQGVEFYSMGGESWGDDPYEGFTEHLMIQEILTVMGEM